MKRILIIAASACVVLAGCIKNEPAPSAAEQQEITFAPPVMGSMTKVNLPAKYPTGTDFAVFAYYYANVYTGYDASSIYMNDVTVSHSEYTGTAGTWKATPAYYWPKAGSLTFAAYSPASVDASHDGSGIHFTDYEIAEKADVDLLFSNRSYDKQSSDENTNKDNYYGVDIVFNHALSAILFKVNAKEELVAPTDDNAPKYEFVVEKIEVVDAYSKGTFSQGLSETDDDQKPKTPVVDANFKNDWTNPSELKTYTAYSGDGITVNSTTAVPTLSEPTGNSNDKVADLILLPQALKDTNHEVTVRVTYKLRHSKMANNVWIENNVVSAPLSVTEVDEWFRGKRYIYTLTISLDEILLAPTVEPWDDKEIDAITIPSTSSSN